MSKAKAELVIPAETTSELARAVEILLTGRRDPEFEALIHAQAQQISQKVLKVHGVLDIGVPAIRSLRDGHDE